MCLIYKNINYKWSVVEVEVVVENRDDCFIQRPPGRRHFLFTMGEELSERTRATATLEENAKF